MTVLWGWSMPPHRDPRYSITIQGSWTFKSTPTKFIIINTTDSGSTLSNYTSTILFLFIVLWTQLYIHKYASLMIDDLGLIEFAKIPITPCFRQTQRHAIEAYLRWQSIETFLLSRWAWQQSRRGSWYDSDMRCIRGRGISVWRYGHRWKINEGSEERICYRERTGQALYPMDCSVEWFWFV